MTAKNTVCRNSVYCKLLLCRRRLFSSNIEIVDVIWCNLMMIKCLDGKHLVFKFNTIPLYIFRVINLKARHGGAEVAGWTVDRKIRVRFPAYPHRVWALWWQEGKRRLRTSRCPCRGRLGTLKTPSCPWRWVPDSRSKFGNWTTVPSLYSRNIAECDVKPQPTNQPTNQLN